MFDLEPVDDLPLSKPTTPVASPRDVVSSEAEESENSEPSSDEQASPSHVVCKS